MAEETVKMLLVLLLYLFFILASVSVITLILSLVISFINRVFFDGIAAI